MTLIVEMLRKHEGVKSHAYKCTAGKITIGVGRNIDPDGGIGLSDDEINYLLANDIKRVTKELRAAFTWFDDLDTVRKEAMVNLGFNLGTPRLKLFKNAIAAMEAGDYETAAAEFLDSRWARQVGDRALTVAGMIRTGGY